MYIYFFSYFFLYVEKDDNSSYYLNIILTEMLKLKYFLKDNYRERDCTCTPRYLIFKYFSHVTIEFITYMGKRQKQNAKFKRNILFWIFQINRALNAVSLSRLMILSVIY